MQITQRTLYLLMVTALPIAASGRLPSLIWMAVGWLVLLLALLLVDWRLTPRPSDWRLRRVHDDRLSLAAQNPVRIHIELRAARALAVLLRDEPPPSFGIDVNDRMMSGRVTPGHRSTFVYHVRPPQRGDYRFGDLFLRWTSNLGLLKRQARFPAAAAVKVYPNLVDVKKYDLLMRQNRLWELGLRSVRIVGSGTEFERLRDYQPDDDYRRINWKATARRGKPISAEYETERSQNIVAMLDIGRMMRSPVGEVAKLDYAVNAILLLAYVATRKGDRLGLLTFADRAVGWLAPSGGSGQFQRLLEHLYNVESQPIEPDYHSAFNTLSTRQRKRSLVLVFSDLTGSIGADALVTQLSRLRRRHLPLLVTISDPSVESLAKQPVRDSVSLYQRTVAEQLVAERRLAIDHLRRLGIATLDVPADRLSVAVIDRYLELKERTLL